MASRDELLPSPKRGEWRSVVREREQSFDEYVRDCVNSRSASRAVFHVQPLGDVDPELPALIRDYGAAFFGLPARIGPPRPVPDAAYLGTRRQHNSSMILDALAERVDADALITLAVTGEDLFARGKQYVFGEGNLDRRVGICSLARLRSADEALFRRRALKLATHEAAHILSIPHCVKRRCLMQGANTIEEADRHPMQPCAADLKKIAWNTGLDPVQRERELRLFEDRVGR